MINLISYRTILILMLILINFLIYGNAAAQCPDDPCPQQTSSGTIVDNPDMSLKWAPGNPPSEISPGTSVPVAVEGGKGVYDWSIVTGEGYTWQNNETYQRTEKPNLSNVLKAAADADCPVSIEVTDDKTPLSAKLNSNNFEFAWDTENSELVFPSGEPPIQVYVNGGKAPYKWEITEGFTLDCEGNCGLSNTVRSEMVECVGTITVTDACGQTVEGKVKRPGYWVKCGERKTSNNCLGTGCKYYKTVVLGDHKAYIRTCRPRPSIVTGTCSVDGWQYTADASEFANPNKCTDLGIWWLVLYVWQCN